MPRVSVVIPNFNHAPFLERRMRSVLDQTFQDFEIIYLDDASTDRSDQVISQFERDPRVRVIRNETNSGNPFKQWNKGVRAAQGEYVWIAESDDSADLKFLQKLLQPLEASQQAGIAYCQSLRIDELDNVINANDDWIEYPERWRHDFTNNGIDECRTHLLFQNKIPNASAVLFRRSTFMQSGFADESMRFCGDWMTWVRMLMISDVAFVAEPLNYYRRHTGSFRYSVTKDGTFQEEAYKVVHCILQNAEVSAEDKELVCQSMMGQWIEHALCENNRIPWRVNRRIYAAAKLVDDKVRRRLAKNVLYYFRKDRRGAATLQTLSEFGRSSEL